MAVAQRGTASNYLQRAPSPSGLAEVLDLILDKGLVIDAYVRVSLVGIELLTIDARIVIASVDTYLRFAEAVNRLDIQPQDQVAGLPGLIREVSSGGSKQKTKGAISGAKESVQEAFSSLTGRGQEEPAGQRQESRGTPSSRRAPQRG